MHASPCDFYGKLMMDLWRPLVVGQGERLRRVRSSGHHNQSRWRERAETQARAHAGAPPRANKAARQLPRSSTRALYGLVRDRARIGVPYLVPATAFLSLPERCNYLRMVNTARTTIVYAQVQLSAPALSPSVGLLEPWNSCHHLQTSPGWGRRR